ncbi:HelD family protein [Ruminiclostridium josui]|uniref:HelD family protein n=1 Tax=Ruminiclostridium josui TaxID=1499 RepID=UPI0004B2E942|nr:UvrD-helicase domain-containing protein [Ruminiclostridium josui]
MNGKQIQEKSLNHIEDNVNDSSIFSNFPDEIEHLEKIKDKLNDALESYNKSVKHYDEQYMDSKRYLANYRSEIDPKEIFQNEISMEQIERAGTHAVKMRDRINKLLESPYFARIDFTEDESEIPSVFYIGRFSFSDANQSNILIYDWRTPISSMFYDCELGQAGYDAPVGRINGDLTRKRQLKIVQGEMKYVLESSINIQDDVLQRELSHTSDEKMKTIIATIQREQNQIIRNEQAETLIIQGVAGSGKTSIALHRIAYLLYRFKDTLSAKNVVILSPNKVFADYISNVLPELGEEPIFEMSFADVAEIQLDGIINFEPDKDPLETNDTAWAERVKFKSRFEFIKMMDDYLEYATTEYFQPTDYEFGNFKVDREWILSRYNAYKNYPIKIKLSEVASDIYDKLQTENIRDDELPKPKSILKKLSEMFKIKNTLALYKDFYKTMKLPDKFVMPDKKTLEWADVYPFMYFHSVFEGLKENKLIKHVIIDEMQDYTPVQYIVLNKLFKCKKTILGDYGQSLNPNHLHSLDDLKKVYEGVNYVELNKSYRSTYEIINFAKQIQNVTKLEPIERHGDIPELISCSDSEDELLKIKEKIDAFQHSGNVTLGIILKTNSMAASLYDKLSKDYDAHLITTDSQQFANGITITSIQMSKGLEFDEVIIPSANIETYYTDYDRKLLYIACTRAMHKLSLLYTGSLTELLKGE